MKNETNSSSESAHPEASDRNDVPVSNGTYKIYSFLSSSKLVDMSLTEGPNGAHNVKLYQDSSAPESRWKITSKGKNYEIRNYKNNLLMLANADGLTDDNVVAEPTNEINLRYQWSFLDAGGGNVEIRNESGGKCLDVVGANTANNTNITLSYYAGLPQQKFRLVRV